MKFAVIFLSVAAIAYGSPVPQESESVLKLVIGNFVNCMNSDFNLCIKEHALRATERLRSLRALKISEGITLLNNAPQEARSLESLSEDPKIRNKQVTERLWEKATDLLENSDLELNYGGEEEESRALGDAEEGRRRGSSSHGGISSHNNRKGSKNKNKMLMPLLLLAKAKAGALALFFLGVIAVSIWKIAIIAKIAFLTKIFALIKSLLAKKGGHEEHVWAQPEEHGHGHGWESQGWGRSRNEANELAYSAYKQQ